MAWRIDIGRDTELAWYGITDGDEFGESQRRTLESKLSELGADDGTIVRLLDRAEHAWTGGLSYAGTGSGKITSPGEYDAIIIEGRFELALTKA